MLESGTLWSTDAEDTGRSLLLLLLLSAASSPVRLLATPWAAANQAPPSVRFQASVGLGLPLPLPRRGNRPKETPVSAETKEIVLLPKIFKKEEFNKIKCGREVR